LSARAVDYLSRDVANDAEAQRRFAATGADGVPAVTQHGVCVPGVDLTQVAALLGLPYDAEPPLPAEVLSQRLRHALTTAMRLVGQLPAQNLRDKLPGRDRSLIGLANHIVAIADSYLDVVAGCAFDAALSAAEPDVELHRAALAERSHTVASKLAATVPSFPAMVAAGGEGGSAARLRDVRV